MFTQFQRISEKVNKNIYIYIYIYDLITHKCVLKAMTAPNPTQTTKSGKYKKPKNRSWSDMGYYGVLGWGDGLMGPRPRTTRVRIKFSVLGDGSAGLFCGVALGGAVGGWLCSCSVR